MNDLSVCNKLILNCVLHGDYQKFINDANKECPHCAVENAKKIKTEEINLKKIGFRLGVKSITVQCERHGESRFNVPEFMIGIVNECPHCANDKRKEVIQPKIKQVIDMQFRESGIPENCINHRFSTIDASRSPKQQTITERLIMYIKNLAEKGTSYGEKNILLSGNMGTGKTLYASILLKEVLRRSLDKNISDEKDIRLKSSLSVQFVSEPMLLNEITATWKSNTENSKALMERLASKSILCIDDVGAITSTHAHLLDFYASLLDERYKRRLPTIITSNLHYEDLRLAIGTRSVDRFMEKNRIIVANFDWQGYRSGEVGTDELEIF
ncbi:AAA family ATPase [Acinetobacter bereziniae]|uniref:AAA family ATPase n=1 Tax=Acinetobacter bereziniae TaxID=106648 RepID=UPI00124FE232|nr:AAA family ATPase [Acinetobacter bereziniae]MCU4320630.1 ATP-binding protein [Acinetobacter bereziniae]